MTAMVRGALVAALALCVACSDRPTAPSQLPPSTGQPAPPTVTGPTPIVVPPLSGPARTYLFSAQLGYPVSHFTMNSKYVLYENGAFLLQYVSLGGELTGVYESQNGRLNFRFGGGGDATGTLDNDVLEVRYSERMQHSDFENAVYKRAP